MEREHIPVLAQEVVTGLRLFPGAHVIDATLGLGGHARLLLERIGPDGILYGFDRDQRNLATARERLHAYRDQLRLFHDSFANIGGHGIPPVDAVLFDLGFSSVHVDDPSRGFSFLNEGPLDMRYDTTQELTAAAIVQTWSVGDMARILRLYGEEERANDIAKEIARFRREHRLETTTQLADIIASVKGRRGKTHPATQTFQALRVAVNEELTHVEAGLAAALDILKPAGILAVITFHSLEDRLTKQFTRRHANLTSLTKKPIRPSSAEIEANPRARSAKLRLAQKHGGYETDSTRTIHRRDPEAG